MLREYAGGAKRTSLAGDITATSTNILVADATGYPTGATGPFAVALNTGAAAEEKILVASRSGNTLTVATGGRGYDGTTAAEHRTGTNVDHVLTATDVREANAHVNDTTGDPHPQYLTDTDASAAYEAKVSRTAATTGQVPALQGDGSLAFTTLGADAVKIAEVVLGAAAASISFTSIPATYRHLLLLLDGRSTDAAAAVGCLLRLNGDATAVYDYQRLKAEAATVNALEAFGQVSITDWFLPGAGAPAGLSGSIQIVVPNYAGTTFNKTARVQSNSKFGTGSGGLQLRDVFGAWRSSVAINALSLTSAAGNFAVGTTATLYGLK